MRSCLREKHIRHTIKKPGRMRRANIFCIQNDPPASRKRAEPGTSSQAVCLKRSQSGFLIDDDPWENPQKWVAMRQCNKIPGNRESLICLLHLFSTPAFLMAKNQPCFGFGFCNYKLHLQSGKFNKFGWCLAPSGTGSNHEKPTIQD